MLDIVQELDQSRIIRLDLLTRWIDDQGWHAAIKFEILATKQKVDETLNAKTQEGLALRIDNVLAVNIRNRTAHKK